MKTSTLLGILFVVGVIAIVVYSSRGSQSPEQYAEGIKEERGEKDIFMKTDKDSPFASSPEDFKGLNYFPADLKYKVKASLVDIQNKSVLVLPTSSGEKKSYLQYAYAEFDIDQTQNRLMILELTDPGPYKGTLFLAFSDETSARETYGAGRYLELKKTPGSSTIILDFNKAYNPYCAYSNNFSCPFPPPENVLKVAIRAGEKSYH